jgi:5'-nucleotidase
MTNFKSSLLVVSLLTVSIFTGCGSNDNSKQVSMDDKALELSVIHVNDEHSHVLADRMSLYFNGNKVKGNVGGFPRVATKIKALQAANENTLTLNAGDTFQGTMFYSLFKGDADAAMLNSIEWDAVELGNHEFDDGDEHLASYLDQLTTVQHFLGANVTPKQGNILDGKWSGTMVKEFSNGAKVGVVGVVISQKTKESSNPSDEIIFHDEVTTAQAKIDELKAQGINKILLLSHVGLGNDLQFATELSGVDVIIGGDSHSLMGDFSAVGLNSVRDNYPEQTKDKDGNPVCVAQAWQYNYVVGNLDVNFDNNGIVTSCKGTPTLLLSEDFKSDDNETLNTIIKNTIANNTNLEVVPEDSVVAATLKEYSDQVEAQEAKTIGTASEFLGHNRIPGDKKDGVSDLPLGSDIAPIVAKSFYDLSNRADACIQNAGGVRIAINEGNITMGIAYTLLPFANTLYEIEMYGSEIKQVLEDSLTNIYDNGGSTGSFPYAYGLRYDINSKAQKDSRISNLEIKDRKTGQWSTIDNSKLYVIVTNSYIASGKDGYVTFQKVQNERGPGVDTYLDYALSFVRYVENKTANSQKVSKLPSSEHCIKSFQ